jgi:hypothetical protein
MPAYPEQGSLYATGKLRCNSGLQSPCTIFFASHPFPPGSPCGLPGMYPMPLFLNGAACKVAAEIGAQVENTLSFRRLWAAWSQCCGSRRPSDGTIPSIPDDALPLRSQSKPRPPSTTNRTALVLSGLKSTHNPLGRPGPWAARHGCPGMYLIYYPPESYK